MIVTFDGNNADALAAADLANVTGIEIIESATDAAAVLRQLMRIQQQLHQRSICQRTPGCCHNRRKFGNYAALTIVGGGGTNTVTLSASASVIRTLVVLGLTI